MQNDKPAATGKLITSPSSPKKKVAATVLRFQKGL